jgi:hypothetical protein
MAPCRCRVGACTWREEGGGRREEGARPAAYLEGGRWRLAAPDAISFLAAGGSLRDGGWRTDVWAISFLRLLGAMDDPAG